MANSNDTKLRLKATLTKLRMRLPLYVRVGWMMLVAFAMVGDCAGHREGAVVVFLVTAAMWVGMRIITEGQVAMSVLVSIAEHEAALKRGAKKGDDDGPPPMPPTAPAV